MIAVLCILSCTESALDKSTHDLNGNWTHDNVLSGDLSTSQAMAKRVALNIDFSESFPFENLYINYTLVQGQDTIASKTKSIPLQNDIGQWQGEKSGPTYSYTSVLEQIELSSSSEPIRYRIEQYSRENTLNGLNKISILLN